MTKCITLLQMKIKKFFLVLVEIDNLQFIKIKQENEDIQIYIKIIGLNPVLILLVDGPAGACGIDQQQQQGIKIYSY